MKTTKRSFNNVKTGSTLIECSRRGLRCRGRTQGGALAQSISSYFILSICWKRSCIWRVCGSEKWRAEPQRSQWRPGDKKSLLCSEQLCPAAHVSTDEKERSSVTSVGAGPPRGSKLFIRLETWSRSFVELWTSSTHTTFFCWPLGGTRNLTGIIQ